MKARDALMAKKDSRQLGRAVKQPASPDEAKLESVPNPHPDADYVVRFTAPEFTTLCPITGQPDFAHLVIDYVPGKAMVESKSLKLFLTSFRNRGGFHEDTTIAIAKRIAAAIKPEISAHRRLLVSARRHADRRVLADRKIAARMCGCPIPASRPIAGGADASFPIRHLLVEIDFRHVAVHRQIAVHCFRSHANASA